MSIERSEAAGRTVLDHLVGFEVFEVPRPPPGEAGSQRLQALAAVVSAFHAGAASPLAMAWSRPFAGGPVQVLVGGEVLAGSVSDGIASLRLPAGARAQVLPGPIDDPSLIPEGQPPPPAPPRYRLADLSTHLMPLRWWQSIDAVADVLTAGEPGQADRRPSLEDGLLSVWQAPFAWLLIAEPLGANDLDEATKQTWLATRKAMAHEKDSPKLAIEAERERSRYRELSQAPATGMWKVRLLAGAATESTAAEVAGMVSASVDLTDLPYQLIPRRGDPLPLSVALRAEPSIASSALVAALAVPPAREVPGIRLVDRPRFDVTPETSRAGLEVGVVLDGNRQPAGPVRLPTDSLNRHTFVAGATGGGKSQTIRTLLESATERQIPWLVVEPAKSEYRAMASRGAQVIAIRPGEVDVPPASINPLEPAPGFPLQTHADLVKALFLAAFEAQEPFPQVLSAALTRCYTELGWDLALGEPINPAIKPRFPTLADLERTAEQVVNEIGYGREIADNVRGFVQVRLASLRLGTTGRFLGSGHPIDFSELLQRNVVLEIEDVGDDMSKAFLMGTILLRLVEHLRVSRTGQGEGLRHLTVIEEAHRLLRRPRQQGPAEHAVEMFAAMLAEVRAYGEGIVIAEQIPSKLIDDVIKNTAVKIVHRLPAADDRAAVGATMHMSEEQSGYVVTLLPGEAAIFADGMDYPVLTRMRLGDESGAAVVMQVDPVIGTHSRTCTCAAQPCTLRELTLATRPDPLLTVWAELAVLGHLTGWGLPLARRPLRDTLRTMPVRLRDASISHAIDAAVAARSAAISDTISPGELAEHLADGIRAWLDRGERACGDDEPHWTVAAPTSAVVFGDRAPTAIEGALGVPAAHPDWNARLHQALSAFRDCQWPVNLLGVKDGPEP